MNLNLQHKDIVSIKNETVISKDILALLNYKISLDLKDYELISLDDNYLLIKKDTLEWALHIRTSQHKGFWNYKILENSFSIFSIENDVFREKIIMDWFKNLLSEELNVKIENKIKLEISFSDRMCLIKQILNVSKTECTIDSQSKYLTKKYWLENSI